VSAAIEAWYPGIRGAEAIANILFGEVNPSAKLPMTFAKAETDLPHPTIAKATPTTQQLATSTPPFVAGGGGRGGGRGAMAPFDIPYPEGLKVGYKWFDAQDKQPLFAFGFGLSYTTYAYSGLTVTPGPQPKVSFTVKNTGKRAGAEIAEVYAELPPAAAEPPKRLVAWDKVQLAPGESKTVSLTLEPKFLSIFNVEKDAWDLVPGDYKVFVGGSSRQTPLIAALRM